MRILICGLLALGLTVPGCSKKSAPRSEVKPVDVTSAKISDFAHPALVRTKDGTLVMTAFIHPTAPSATEAYDAMGVFTSKDNGTSWSDTSRIASHNTNGVWGYDLAADRQGRLYLTWTAAIYNPQTRMPLKSIMFARSDDAGRSWTTPVVVSDAQSEQRRNPVLAVYQNHVYIAWLDQRRPSAGRPKADREDVCFSASRNRGRTWSTNTCLEPDPDALKSSAGTPVLCVDDHGTLYAAYFAIRRQPREGGFWIARSTDGGASFTTKLHKTGALGSLSLIHHEGALYLAAVAITGIKKFSMQDPQTFQQIRLFVSTDGGEDWSKPVRIDNDSARNHKGSLRLVWLGEQRLAAVWDDERGEVYFAGSDDMGQSWGPNVSLALRSRVGITPLDIAADVTTSRFFLVTSDIVKGPGDVISLTSGRIAHSTP